MQDGNDDDRGCSGFHLPWANLLREWIYRFCVFRFYIREELRYLDDLKLN